MYRNVLRSLRQRLPSSEEAHIRLLLRQGGRAKPGDEVLPARVISLLRTTYGELEQVGRRGFLSVLARHFDADPGRIAASASKVAALGSEVGRDDAAFLQARADLLALLEPPYERLFHKCVHVHACHGWLESAFSAAPALAPSVASLCAGSPSSLRVSRF